MAKRIRIIIDVDYDVAHRVPSTTELRKKVQDYIDCGMVTPKGDEVVEQHTITAESFGDAGLTPSPVLLDSERVEGIDGEG